MGASTEFVADGVVAAGTTGALSHSLAAVVEAPADPDGSNDLANLDLDALVDHAVVVDGFETTPVVLAPVPARAGPATALRRDRFAAAADVSAARGG